VVLTVIVMTRTINLMYMVGATSLRHPVLYC
jgi:hypothetical protein